MSQTVALEFKRETGNLAAFGSDTLVYLDGRWDVMRRKIEIYTHVAYLRHKYPEKYKDVHFVGLTYLGRSDYTPGRLDVPMSDREPPAWVTRDMTTGLSGLAYVAVTIREGARA